MKRKHWRRGSRVVTLLAAAATLASLTSTFATADTDSGSQANVP